MINMSQVQGMHLESYNIIKKWGYCLLNKGQYPFIVTNNRGDLLVKTAEEKKSKKGK